VVLNDEENLHTPIISLNEDQGMKDEVVLIEEIMLILKWNVVMPLLRCKGKQCQHEYESYDDYPKCNWCG